MFLSGKSAIPSVTDALMAFEHYDFGLAIDWDETGDPVCRNGAVRR